MTDITKRRLKNITNHAFEVCIGSTIYSFMSEFENAAINKLYSAIKNKTTVSVIIKSAGCDLVSDDEKRNIVMVLMRDYLCEKTSDETIDTNYLPSKLIFYRKTPILITAPKKKTDERSSLAHRYGGAPVHYYGLETPSIIPVRSAFTHPTSSENNNCFTLTTIRSDKHEANLNRFVKLLKKKAKEYNKPTSESKYIHVDSPSTELSFMKKRTMDTVFMHQNTKDELIKTIDAFVNKKDWYDTNFVPYHFGILLYGPPGTGKSTLIRALITEYCNKYKNYRTPTYLSYIHEICRFSNDQSNVNGGSEPKPRLVILEDIDVALLQKRQSIEVEECVDDDNINPPYYNRNSTTTLSEVLNKIDGVNNTENVIYIFTTNHIENLDPALLRPGRIDKIIKIDTPDRDCYDQFMHYHFGKHIPDDVQVTSDKLIAELQNEIVCEKSFDEVLDLIKSK